jgi:uracil-DNA glycosylase family protein
VARTGSTKTAVKLAALRQRAATCTACDLYQRATQTVFGEGSPTADSMLVGEQPGDREDRAGQPFVGPAGRLLDQALADINVDRERIYVTNAVKHFKWRPQGKRRIHEPPNRTEQLACRPWLLSELELVQPRLVVCLGRVAATAVLDRPVKLGDIRGVPIDSDIAEHVMVTVHPSSVLRLEETARRQAYEAFRNDLATAFSWLA